jgi:DNA-3-methyladenine glycosylase I
MEEQGISLNDFLWSFAPRVPFGRTGIAGGEYPIASQSPEATQLSKDLKRRGWKFVGPTTMYSMMQSVGMVNDHVEGCCVRDECEQQRVLTLRDFPHEEK